MPEAFHDQLPAPDERGAQDQRGIIPDELVFQRRPVNGKRRHDNRKDCWEAGGFVQGAHHGSLRAFYQACLSMAFASFYRAMRRTFYFCVFLIAGFLASASAGGLDPDI